MFSTCCTVHEEVDSSPPYSCPSRGSTKSFLSTTKPVQRAPLPVFSDVNFVVWSRSLGWHLSLDNKLSCQSRQDHIVKRMNGRQNPKKLLETSALARKDGSASSGNNKGNKRKELWVSGLQESRVTWMCYVSSLLSTTMLLGAETKEIYVLTVMGCGVWGVR